MSEEELSDLDDDAKAALQAGEVQVEDEDPDAEYGERVRKRIGKEVSKRKAIETQLESERAERARLDAELAESRKRLSSYESEQDEGLKTKAEDLKSRRDKALDDGDLSEYNRLNDELMDARIELRDRSTRRPAVQEEDRPQQQVAAPQASQDWVARNRAWLAADEANLSLAKGLEQKLAKKHGGYNDALYRELSKRLAAVSEDFIDDDGDDLERYDDPPPRSTTAGVPRESFSDSPRRAAGKLTRDDLSAMSRYGMDPNSPSDRKAWLNRNAEL